MYTYRVRNKENISGLSNALLAIYNSVGSGKKVSVFNMELRNVTSMPNSGVTAGVEDAKGITAVDGGVDLPYAKFNSTDGNLPSQVKILMNPTATQDALISYMRGCINYRYNNARGLFPQVYSGGYSGLDMASNYWDGIVLREGEGIIWKVSTLNISNFYRMSCIFSTGAAGNPTYIVDSEYNFNHDEFVNFALFNGVGSGVVLTIKYFGSGDTGDDTLPAFAVIPIDDVVGGETLTPYKIDSSNPAIPGTIIAVSDGVIRREGRRDGISDTFMFAPDVPFGVGYTNWMYFWDRTFYGPRIMLAKHVLSGDSVNQALRFFKAQGGDFDDADLLAGVTYVLNEGEGIAIVQMQPDIAAVTGMALTYRSSRFNYNVTATFGIEDVVPTAGLKAPILGGLVIQ